MESIEDKIYRLIDEQKQSELNVLVKDDEQLGLLVREILFLKNGFKSLQVDSLTNKLQDYENDLLVIEDVMVKTRKLDKVNTLTQSLKSFEKESFDQNEKPKSEAKVFSIRPWIKYAAACSIFIIASIGLFRNMDSSFDLDQYYIESLSMATRSDAQSSEIIKLTEEKKWEEIISTTNSGSLTMLQTYHLGIAYMHTSEYQKSIDYLEQVVASRLPEYEELALYHQMINLYMLDDEKYQDIQSKFLQDPSNRFYGKARELD